MYMLKRLMHQAMMRWTMHLQWMVQKQFLNRILHFLFVRIPAVLFNFVDCSFGFMQMEKSEIVEKKHPFRMFLRIRPQKNGKMEPTEYLHPQDSKTLKVTVPEDSQVFLMDMRHGQNYKKGRIEAEFEYQDIFLPASTQVDLGVQSENQEQVFDTTTKPLLDGFLQGNSCLIMAYGVTGSGKTYTVLGPGE